jgi:hypothetical protein
VAGRRTRGIVALALIVACALISSCGESSSSDQPASNAAPAPPAPPAVGRSLRIQANATALVVTVSRVDFPLRGTGALLSPGDRAAGVDIAVRNVGHGVYDSSSESDVHLRTSAGDAEPSFASQGSCATSEIDFLKEVEPGESRRGCVAFDVARDGRPIAVRFEPEGRAARGRTWLVKR